MTPRFQAEGVGEMLLPSISMEKLGRKSLQLHLSPMRRNSVLSGFNFNLFCISSLGQTSKFCRLYIYIELPKLDVLEEIVNLCVICIWGVFDILGFV